MNTLHKSIAGLTLGFMLVGVQAQQKGDDIDGKRIDNARVDLHSVSPPAEIEPLADYPLPSGVTRSEAKAMVAAAANLPQAQPQLQKSFTDNRLGALFVSGKAFLTDDSKAMLDRLAGELKGRKNLKIAIAGHTDNQHLSANARKLFKDNQGLSEARSLTVAAYLKQALALESKQFAIEGFGEFRPVAGNDTPEGMAKNRRVELRIWFDEDLPASVVKLPARSPCAPDVTGKPALPFRITVDGEPIDPTDPALEADRQRCVDVALERADIQVRYDGLAISPAMNAWAWPNAVVRGEKVEFRAWSNYIPWIKKSELRFFRPGQKPQETPLLVVPASWTAPVIWTTPSDSKDEQVFFLLRVYDAEGRFNETGLKPLTLLAHPRPLSDADTAERERLTGYGEDSLSLRNIPVKGGTVTVNGTDLKRGQSVEALGLQLPVDISGKFAMKQILPAGPNSVEVKVINADGTSTTFRRNLTIPVDDWFYVAVGDLTMGRNNVSGPAALVTGDTQHYDEKVYLDGRGAFYLKGKIKGEYLLTASADTTEQPLNQMFTNFSSKDPRYLLRNINPDLYYPVYGDDSTTVDDAPTQGKLYVKLQKGDSHVMWGNFQTSWSGTELLQYSRGLYGANGRYRSEATTQWGEKKTQVDAFAADPGTIASREEFRGTGGSLYYLRHQDITQGSERIWVEVRDKDSGLVLDRKELSAAQDYEVNYLQGRITLRDALPSLASGGGLVMSSAVGGNPQYLVTTYEFAPGLSAVNNFSTGVRASQWFGDNVQLGVTSYHQGETGADQTLTGADATFRKNPNTYFKVEAARSSGTGNGSQTSQDGGFSFNGLNTTTTGDANAYRVEAAADLGDVSEGAKGRIAAYTQNRERGFSGPGQIAGNGEAVQQHGGKAEWQVAENTRLEAKADVRNADTADSKSLEVAVRQQLDEQWGVAVGVRRDDRENTIANASPTLSQNGGRTDALARLEYKPAKDNGKPGEKDDWDAYGFAQSTLERDGNRSDNDRFGGGAGWRVNDRLKLNAEASGGNLGPGGKLGADYRLSDRSNGYLNYVVESENPDSDYRGRQGTWVSGSNYRISDSVRLFGETKATNGAGPQSLSQAFGADWAPNDRWTFGSKMEVGKLSDEFAGDTRRRAIGFSVGYKEDRLKYSGNLELRSDENNLSGHSNTWLVRNTAAYQLDKAWRLMGKINWSDSNNTNGAFFDGGYHEVVAAAAYRPVDNDRWNTLFKYTNFYNLPSPGQIAADGTTADYAQKSQVLAVDTIYDLEPWLSVGGKYAIRIGELKASKTSGDWFSSQADLLVLRADWHFVKEWDALVEWRNLRAREAQDARAGALVAIYRHVAEGVKIGAGYNFTTYSDDLTDLSFRSRGWFINVLGEF